jgi:hypothetical protein
MEKTAAYLISVGIIGFGLWILDTHLGPAIWLVGFLPVAIGLASIFGEIQSSRLPR